MAKKSSWKNPLSGEVRVLIRKKHRLWTKFQKNKDKKIEAEYKQIKNLVRKETRKINQKMQHDIAINCKSNPKVFWQYVNSKNNSDQ